MTDFDIYIFFLSVTFLLFFQCQFVYECAYIIFVRSLLFSFMQCLYIDDVWISVCCAWTTATKHVRKIYNVCLKCQTSDIVVSIGEWFYPGGST